MITTDKYLNMF